MGWRTPHGFPFSPPVAVVEFSEGVRPVEVLQAALSEEGYKISEA